MVGNRSSARWAYATILAGLLCSSWPIVASTVTAPINVTMTTASFCTFSASNIAFGSYSGMQIDATGVVTVRCTNSTGYQIGIDGGLNTGGAYDWNMVGPANALLSYKLYRDSARTSYWGGTRGQDSVDGTGNGAVQTYTIYGRIAAGQYKAPGVYGDTVTFYLYY